MPFCQNLKHVLPILLPANIFSFISLIDSNGSDYVTFEIFIQKLNANEVLNDKIPLIFGNSFLILMI
jgi:hypothetical protein